jgi:hypothetical protein
MVKPHRKQRRRLIPREAELPLVPESSRLPVSTEEAAATVDSGDMEESIRRMIEAAYT